MPAGRPLRDRSLLFEHCEDTIASCDELRDLARSLSAQTGRELQLVQAAIAAGAADMSTLLTVEALELRDMTEEDGIAHVVNALLAATHDTLRRANCLHLWPTFEAEATQHLTAAIKARQVAGQRFTA